MKWVVGCFMLVSIAVSSCQKEVVPAYGREKPHAVLETTPDVVFSLPRVPGRLRPDTLLPPVLPTLPTLPKLPRAPLGEPVLMSPCIYSYDELVSVLGTNKVQAKAVILDGGPLGDITLERSDDLPGIWYTAVAGATGSSLFRSQLQVEWRPDPSVYFMGFTADVWSVGCVYTNAALGPYTNLLKDGVEILINTCFFWGATPYEHLRIKYLVL